MYFTENEWQMCRPGRMEESAFWSVPLLFLCNDFIFACEEDFIRAVAAYSKRVRRKNHRVPMAREGGEHERGAPPLFRGVRGPPPYGTILAVIGFICPIISLEY